MAWNSFLQWATVGVLAATIAAPSSAAFITIDDSDPNTVTITAGDFEGGFSVNGTLLTIGLGASASITLPDEGYLIDGSWIDLGAAADTRVDILFALPIDPTFATSGIEFAATSDGFTATLAGSIGAFVDPSLYFSTPLPTHLQDGRTMLGSTAFLSVAFVSEGVLPEPGSLALASMPLLYLAVLRMRKKRIHSHSA